MGNAPYEELHSLYRSPNIARVFISGRLRQAAHVARMEESINAFNILTGKPTLKIPLTRPRSRWKDNIRMSIKETGINTRDYWRVLVNAA